MNTLIVLSLFSAVLSSSDFCDDKSLPGPYQYTSTDSIQISNNGRYFYIYLYFPSLINRNALTFPILLFAHGYLQPDFEYFSYLEHFASHGYIAIAPNADYSPLPSMQEFASDMNACLDYITTQNSNTTSIFYNKVDINSVGVFGHSLGGFITILTDIPSNPRIKALAPIAGSTDDNSLKNITAPQLLLCGDVDFFFGPDLCNQSFQLSNSPKIMAMIRGGWHCGFMDESIELPDVFCRPLEDWIERETQMMITRCLLTPFFDLYLKGDDSSRDYVWGTRSQSLFMTNQTTDAGFMVEPHDQTLEVSSLEETVNFTLLLTTNSQSGNFQVEVTESSCETEVTPSEVTLSAGDSVKLFVLMKPSSGSENNAIISVIAPDGLTSQYAQVVALVSSYK